MQVKEVPECSGRGVYMIPISFTVLHVIREIYDNKFYISLLGPNPLRFCLVVEAQVLLLES